MTVINEADYIEHNREIPIERYIYPEERQKIVDDMRLI